MLRLVDWEYYSSLHSKIREREFYEAEELAEKEVQRMIGWVRWADITEETFGVDVLKDCICDVIDQLAVYDRSGSGKGLSSVSNDGYSESYVIQTESQKRNEIQNLIRASLSGTGLIGAY